MIMHLLLCTRYSAIAWICLMSKAYSLPFESTDIMHEVIAADLHFLVCKFEVIILNMIPYKN